jgi:hypothetical protein
MISDSYKLKYDAFCKLMRPAMKVALMNNLTIPPSQIKSRFKKAIEGAFIAFNLHDRQGVSSNRGNGLMSNSSKSPSHHGLNSIEGEIDWQEILHCWALLAGGANMTLIEKLNLCFCICDRSCIGSVDRSEVSALLLYALDMFSPKVSKFAAEAGIGTNDTSGSTFSLKERSESFDDSDHPNDSTGVSYSSDSVPLILDDLFPSSEHTIMPRLNREQFVTAILAHNTALDFILLGASAHLRSQVPTVRENIFETTNKETNKTSKSGSAVL